MDFARMVLSGVRGGSVLVARLADAAEIDAVIKMAGKLACFSRSSGPPPKCFDF